MQYSQSMCPLYDYNRNWLEFCKLPGVDVEYEVSYSAVEVKDVYYIVYDYIYCPFDVGVREVNVNSYWR